MLISLSNCKFYPWDYIFVCAHTYRFPAFNVHQGLSMPMKNAILCKNKTCNLHLDLTCIKTAINVWVDDIYSGQRHADVYVREVDRLVSGNRVLLSGISSCSLKYINTSSYFNRTTPDLQFRPLECPTLHCSINIANIRLCIIKRVLIFVVAIAIIMFL